MCIPEWMWSLTAQQPEEFDQSDQIPWNVQTIIPTAATKLNGTLRQSLRHAVHNHTSKQVNQYLRFLHNRADWHFRDDVMNDSALLNQCWNLSVCLSLPPSLLLCAIGQYYTYSAVCLPLFGFGCLGLKSIHLSVFPSVCLSVIIIFSMLVSYTI